jgi:hypothetical protein
MRITGAGIWGDPPNHDVAIKVLRRAVELGVDFIDTTDSYAPYVSEDFIREALYPYSNVLIATKGALTRQGPDKWEPVGAPAYLRQCVQMSLRRLDDERIDPTSASRDRDVRGQARAASRSGTLGVAAPRAAADPGGAGSVGRQPSAAELRRDAG